ncbi:MAG: hypothetical protein JNM38_23305 [Acidobacteria bacterium]|nr:hypothetical protein [Acidobacteriota bacterium]
MRTPPTPPSLVRRVRLCRRAAVGAIVLATLGSAGLVADVALSQRAADSLQRKVLTIVQYGETPLAGARLTPITEAELNSYLRFVAGPQLPTGVVEPYLRMVGEGRVEGRAVVDLDRVRTARTRGWLDPMNLLTGRLLVSATGSLSAAEGLARFNLSYASIAGIPIPKVVLAELVAFYTQSPDYPRGVGLDDPLPLPSRVREIHVQTGQAVVIQK